MKQFIGVQTRSPSYQFAGKCFHKRHDPLVTIVAGNSACSHNELPMEEAMAGCTRTHVEEERQFIRDLRNAILAEFEKGTGFMEIPNAVRLLQYSHWVGYEEWLEMNTLRLMTDLWMGPFPWIPDAR